MRKLLYVVGAVVVILVGGGAYVVHAGSALDRESHAYVDRAVPAIVGGWSAAQLIRRADPKLLQGANPDAVRAAFALFGKLGPLVSYRGSKGEANMMVTTGRSEIVTAHYVAHAVFSHGGASIDVALHKGTDGAWRILGFHVNSNALIEKAAGRTL